MDQEVVWQKPKSKTNIFFVVIIILFLLLSLISIVYLVSQRTTFSGRATSPSSIPVSGGVEIANSYIFASPLEALGSGREKIRITVFILDDQGKGVSGQTVFLDENINLTETPVQSSTDDLGRAIFDLSTITPGEYFIQARVAGQTLPQRVRIFFR